jgi:hypothetical protein
MKAGKKNTTTVITGKIVKKGFARGSKSEHEAVYLETKDGSYKLKRMGGNPFRDDTLEQLVGKHVTVVGKIDDYQFIATEVKEVSGE